jgi:hypothetical protein
MKINLIVIVRVESGDWRDDDEEEGRKVSARGLR